MTVIDKIQCLFQGRPPLLRQGSFNTPLEFLDEYDELDEFQSITYTTNQHRSGLPSLNVTLLTKLCGLALIIERILCEVYPESTRDMRRQNNSVSEDIKSDLSKWRQSLPPEVDYLSSPRGKSVLLPQSLCLLYASTSLPTMFEIELANSLKTFPGPSIMF